ncbi:MAG: hypothetical protein IJE00_04075 [Clostridia bacterium]|nr:hypothetical protein [Clostridia bacterium]
MKLIFKLIGKIVGWVLGSILSLVVLGLIVCILIQPLLYPAFYRDAEKEFTAAGLMAGNVPQGFTYVEGKDIFLQVGYKANGKSASCIYVTDGNGENVREVELLNADGSAYTGHTGGIAAGEQTVWLANDGDIEAGDNCVWALSLEELLKEETASVTLTEKFHPETRSACVTVYDGLLWVGEFEDPEKYPTKESHHLTAPDGTENPSLICGYTIDETAAKGIASETPVKAISVCKKLQGFAFNAEGKLALSTSYGVSASHIYIHKNVLSGEAQGNITVGDATVPVWYLDGTTLEEDIKAAPMTEELAVKDGRLYVLNESACHKYIFGNFMRGYNVYSIPF